MQDFRHVISRMEHQLSLPRVLGAEGLQEMQEEARDIMKVLERPRGEERRKVENRRLTGETSMSSRPG